MTISRCTARMGLAVVAGSLAFSSADVAHADLINISGDMNNSTEHLGNFVGTLEYAFVGEEQGSLTVTLTNTSHPDNGGYLTGFIFNFGVDVDDTDSAVLLSATYPFLDAPMQNGAPYGNPFLGGAALGGDWSGGGNPTNGIEVGGTGEFTFDINSADAMELTAASFLSGPFEFNFLVRFRGFENGGSDKVPVIPAPASAGLIALGAMSMSSRRRRG